MKKNNYTRAPEGQPDIEAVCFMDCSLSRFYFEENFKILQHEGYRTFTKAYYIENGNVPDADEITFTLGGTDQEIEARLTAEGYSRDEIKAMIPGEPFDILETLYGEKINLLNYQDFNKTFEPLQAVPSKEIEWVSIRGYSQGDYAEVAYCPADLEKAWGNKPNKNALKKDFERFFYDAPVYAHFEINGETYDYSELMPDSYEWDREGFAKAVSEKSGVPAETLQGFLPQYPDYN